MGVKVLAGIAQNGTSDAARVSAVALLFERGWGKPAQLHTGEDGEDGEGPLVVEIVYRPRDRIIEHEEPKIAITSVKPNGSNGHNGT
jgi:hypothetical protein